MTDERWAVISPDGQYRTELGRRWPAQLDGGRGRVVWVMLNPSTADAEQDDPTIRRCIRYSQAWGYDELVVVNLYAYRTPYPRDLGRVDDPVGPDNIATLDRVTSTADLVMAAWGGHPWATAFARELLGDMGGRVLHCLGTTLDGSPRHPLYLRKGALPEPWMVPDA